MPELPPFNNPPPRPEAAPLGEAVTPQPDLSSATSSRDRWQGVQVLAVWSLRWALLGAGVAGAWLFGILVAQFFPAPAPEAPLQEVVSRKTFRFFHKLSQLPAWWAGDTLRPEAAALPPARDTEAVPAPPATRPITLTDAQREQITVELEAIGGDLQRLRDRTSALERQLGLTTLELALEERLLSVERRVFPPTASPQGEDIAAAPSLQATPTATPDPLFQVDAYRVTLPSDVLFAPGEAILQTNAQPLLDTILQDIGRYPGATVIVGSYTNVDAGEISPTDLSFKQAIAVRRYLTGQLGTEAHHWITVGYGKTGLGSQGGVQLNRRVTIAIIP
jgi:outer membrane protein OmpA-like peptidoglycan-associated protein